MSAAMAVQGSLSPLASRLLFPQAVSLARAGRYDDAEAWLRLLLSGDRSAHALCLLGKVYAQQGRYAEAADVFAQAREIDAGHREAIDAAAYLATIATPVSRASLRRWQWASAVTTLVAALGIAAALWRPPSTVESLTAPPGERQRSQAELVEMMRTFAGMTSAVEQFRPIVPITLNPMPSPGGTMTVNVGGAVPAPHVKDRLLRTLAARADGVELRDSVRVTGSYTIRSGDTLAGLAWSLCGQLDAKVLQLRNPAVVPTRLRPGHSIVIACE